MTDIDNTINNNNTILTNNERIDLTTIDEMSADIDSLNLNNGIHTINNDENINNTNTLHNNNTNNNDNKDTAAKRQTYATKRTTTRSNTRRQTKVNDNDNQQLTSPITTATGTRRNTNNILQLALSPSRDNIKDSRRSTLQTASDTSRSNLTSSVSNRDINANNEQNTVVSSIHSDVSELPILHAAVYNNDYKQCCELIKAQPLEFRIEYVNSLDSLGNIALFYALSNDHITSGVTSLLLDYGSNVNHQNNSRNTALHIAFFYSHKKFIKYLIGEFNASVTITNNYDQLCHQTAPQPKGISDSVTAQFQHNGAMLHFITQCTDTYNDNINKKIIVPHTIQQRCYYRSLYDTADIYNVGYLTLNTVTTLLKQIGLIDDKEQEQYTYEWFRSIDRDRNGIVYFNEFLNATLYRLQEREKQRKKELRKQKLLETKLQKKKQEKERMERYRQKQAK